MAKSSKKAAKKSVKKSIANRKPVQSTEGLMTRGQVAEKLKISIYAVDQLLVKKQLRSLSEADVMKFKKTAKSAA